ncbi:hypothetical protein ACIBSW_35495 [Actinoplanes sp. NPDC049668]
MKRSPFHRLGRGAAPRVDHPRMSRRIIRLIHAETHVDGGVAAP